MTLEMFTNGMTIDEIAADRKLTTGSIAGHLVQLAKAGYDIDLASLISPDERREIERAIKTIGLEEGRLKPVFDHFGGRYDYGKLTLVAGLLEK
jgi:ATP-dependent DNA helicase RecQ